MIKIDKVTTPKADYPPEPPKLYAWLATVATVSLVVVTPFLPRGCNPVLRGAGVMVLLLAGLFIFWPFYLLAKHGGPKECQTYMQANGVVDRGLFAITRHPQYLGYIFLTCGFTLLSQHWAAVLLTAAGAAFFYVQAVREERYCLAQFGERYGQYSQRVPRFNIVVGVMRFVLGSRK